MTLTAPSRGAPVRSRRWRDIRAAYEKTDVPLALIGAAYGVGVRSIHSAVAFDGWQRRRSRWALEAKSRKAGAPPDTSPEQFDLIQRMIVSVARQVDDIEARAAVMEERAGDEKDARTLATLAKTLELLITLDKAARAGQNADARPDLDDFRRALAQRIERLRDTDGA